MEPCVSPPQHWMEENSVQQNIQLENSGYSEGTPHMQIEVKLEPVEYSEHNEPEWIIPDAISHVPGEECNAERNSGCFFCNACKQGFSSLDDLQNHTVHCHSYSSITVEYNCQYCNYSTPFLPELNKHLEIHKEKPYKCTQCDETFEFNRYLIQHAVVHSAKKRFECDVCKRQFCRKCDYEMHLPTHTEDPFPCNICSKTFKLYRNLLQHEVVHKEPEKKYMCIVCGKQFRQQCDYFAHTTTHTNDLFRCKICGKLFALKRNLLQHEVVHTQEKNIECTYCDKKFRCLSQSEGKSEILSIQPQHISENTQISNCNEIDKTYVSCGINYASDCQIKMEKSESEVVSENSCSYSDPEILNYQDVACNETQPFVPMFSDGMAQNGQTEEIEYCSSNFQMSLDQTPASVNSLEMYTTDENTVTTEVDNANFALPLKIEKVESYSLCTNLSKEEDEMQVMNSKD